MGYSAGNSDWIMSFSRWQKLMAARMPSAVPPAALREPTAVADWFNEALQIAAPHQGGGLPAMCRNPLPLPISLSGDAFPRGPQPTGATSIRVTPAGPFGLRPLEPLAEL